MGVRTRVVGDGDPPARVRGSAVLKWAPTGIDRAHRERAEIGAGIQNLTPPFRTYPIIMGDLRQNRSDFGPIFASSGGIYVRLLGPKRRRRTDSII